MAQHSLILVDDNDLSYGYEDSNTKLEEITFTNVTVDVNGGIWILYRKPEYNASLSGGSDSDIIIIQKPVSNQKLAFSPCSLYRCENNRDSCTVFEHNNYGGKRKHFNDAGFDLSSDFPAGCTAGASSMIIWPNKDWQLFTKPQFQGGSKVVKDGWLATADAMGFPDDKLLSISPR